MRADYSILNALQDELPLPRDASVGTYQMRRESQESSRPNSFAYQRMRRARRANISCDFADRTALRRRRSFRHRSDEHYEPPGLDHAEFDSDSQHVSRTAGGHRGAEVPAASRNTIATEHAGIRVTHDD